MQPIRSTLLFAAVLLLAGSPARAQSLDPRYYVNTPVGMNFAVAGFAYGWGGVLFDPTVPIDDAKINFEGPILGYSRSVNFWGKSGKVTASGGGLCAHGSGLVNGVAETRNVCGLTDATAGASVNLIGAPALGLREFAHYRQGFLLGASFNFSVPIGQYDADRLLNIGAHRWSFRPQVGVSQAMGRLIVEALVSAQFFTTNGDFFGGHVRTQAPLYAAQLNTIYTFRSGIWGSVGVTAYGGGRTSVDGVPSREIQENWRVGGSLVIPINRQNSLKLIGATGLYARTGGNFSSVGAAWVYLWGGKKTLLAN